MKIQPAESRKKHWADRHGAWIVSLCLHFAVIVLILTQEIPKAPSRETVSLTTVNITLSPAAPEEFSVSGPVPEEEAAAPAETSPLATAAIPVVEPAAPEDMASVRADNAAAPDAGVPDAGAPDGGAHDTGTAAPPPPNTPLSSGDGGTALVATGANGASPEGSLTPPASGIQLPPSTILSSTGQQIAAGDAEAARRAEDAQVGEILAGYGKAAAGNRAEAFGERRDIDKRIQKVELATVAAPHFPGFGGARTNVIRTLNLGNVDPALGQKVMDRYSIHITHRYVESINSLNYLSSVATGNAVFHPTNKPGDYEVFEISPDAHRRMVWLEQNYLVTHGYDPASTKLDRVDFGIVETSPGTWDLGILSIKVNQFGQLGIPDVASPRPATAPAK
jgi:hypothetical protein